MLASREGEEAQPEDARLMASLITSVVDASKQEALRALEQEGEVAASAVPAEVQEEAQALPWMIGACLARVDYYWSERDFGIACLARPVILIGLALALGSCVS